MQFIYDFIENNKFTCISWQDPTNDSCNVKALTTAYCIKKKKSQFLWVFRWLKIIQKVSAWKSVKLAHHSKRMMTSKPSCPEAKYAFAFLHRNWKSFNSFMSCMNSSFKIKRVIYGFKAKWCVSYFLLCLQIKKCWFKFYLKLYVNFFD